nr:uncharacterized protein LOC111999267 isoform X3 [Quercus suber]
MVSQSESFSGSEGDDGTATELEEKIKSDTTTTESFSGSKGDDGTATELEEKIKSDTATVVCGLVSLWSFRGLCWAAIAVD